METVTAVQFDGYIRETQSSTAQWITDLFYV